MKLSKLVQLAKEDKYIILVNKVSPEKGIVRQHIWIDRGLYPLDGMPVIGKDELLKVLDIPEDKHCDWYVGEKEMDEKLALMAADNPPGKIDSEATPCGLSLHMREHDVMAVYTPEGIRFIDKKCFDVIKDEKGVDWWWRKIGLAGVLVAKKGFKTIATISCTKSWMDEDVLDDLWHIANAARTIYDQSKYKEQNTEQLSMESNDETADG